MGAVEVEPSLLGAGVIAPTMQMQSKPKRCGFDRCQAGAIILAGAPFVVPPHAGPWPDGPPTYHPGCWAAEKRRMGTVASMGPELYVPLDHAGAAMLERIAEVGEAIRASATAV
jgi:hypothetical protein